MELKEDCGEVQSDKELSPDHDTVVRKCDLQHNM